MFEAYQLLILLHSYSFYNYSGAFLLCLFYLWTAICLLSYIVFVYAMPGWLGKGGGGRVLKMKSVECWLFWDVGAGGRGGGGGAGGGGGGCIHVNCWRRGLWDNDRPSA